MKYFYQDIAFITQKIRGILLRGKWQINTGLRTSTSKVSQ